MISLDGRRVRAEALQPFQSERALVRSRTLDFRLIIQAEGIWSTCTLEVTMFGTDNPKPITANEFKALCIQARALTKGGEECSLLYSLCQVMIGDLGDPDLADPPISLGTTELVDLIVCDFLIHRYRREGSFDPFPIIQANLLDRPNN
jgi:hypothetical protein